MTMEVAVDATTGFRVQPDGTPAQGRLVDGVPFLHVLPKLWLPYKGLDVAHPTAISLESLTLPEIGWKAEGKFDASRPYPNWNYVVFGQGRRLGLMIPLNEPLPAEITLEAVYFLSGNFRTSMAGFYMEVYHTQRLTVERSDVGVDCYSTETTMPTVICGEEYNKVFEERHGTNVVSIGHPIMEDDSYLGDEWRIDTREVIRPLSNHYLSSDEFEDFEPHHAKAQVVFLSHFNEEHRRNACIEMPAKVFTDAVALAGRPVVEGALPEEHPALIRLTEWWNGQDSIPEPFRCARASRILIRFRDEDEYHDLDLEVPAEPITDFSEATNGIATCAARVGDHLLVVFLKGQQSVWEDEAGSHYPMVNGAVYEHIGAPKEEFPVGFNTLDGLRGFARAYPEIYAHYAKQQ